MVSRLFLLGGLVAVELQRDQNACPNVPSQETTQAYFAPYLALSGLMRRGEKSL